MKKLIIVLLFPIIANAASNSLSEYLNNEPAKLMDIGMLRLENLTNWV